MVVAPEDGKFFRQHRQMVFAEDGVSVGLQGITIGVDRENRRTFPVEMKY